MVGSELLGLDRTHQLRLAGIEHDLARGAPPVKVDVARLVEMTKQSKPEAATMDTNGDLAIWHLSCARRCCAAGAHKHHANGCLPCRVRLRRPRAVRSLKSTSIDPCNL